MGGNLEYLLLLGHVILMYVWINTQEVVDRKIFKFYIKSRSNNSKYLSMLLDLNKEKYIIWEVQKSQWKSKRKTIYWFSLQMILSTLKEKWENRIIINKYIQIWQILSL